MLPRIMTALILALTSASSLSEAAVTLPKFFKDGMVLQQEPQKAQIWGSTGDNENEVVSVHILCQSGFEGDYEGALDGATFQVEIGPVPEGEICKINVMLDNVMEVKLANVLFGDVWICSGQSNMVFPMTKILNAPVEIASSAEFTSIRMYKVPLIENVTEQEDLLQEIWTSWADPTDERRLGDFSAVCFLFARTISQRIGKKPFGLIDISWDSTGIEAWSPPESLAKCVIPDYIDNYRFPFTSKSNLFHGMIHPFIRKSIKGVLWYQGETNAVLNHDQYICTFQGIISAWRKRWSENSPTNPDFPFGFAQLASWKENCVSYEFPSTRWHQTMDFGFAPNDVLKNVFMAVTLDTYDFGEIHPRNKKVVGERLATSGLNVAYGRKDYPTNGPFFNKIEFTLGLELSALVSYDQEFSYNPVETSGFYICIHTGGIDQCDLTAGSWQLLEYSSVQQVSPSQLRVSLPQGTVGLAYLWNESPVIGMLAAPIYSNDQHQLPGAPWKYAIDQAKSSPPSIFIQHTEETFSILLILPFSIWFFLFFCRKSIIFMKNM